MVRRYNLLILAPDTTIGQTIIKKINDHFHFLNVAIPTGNYKQQCFLPPNQIVLNYANVNQLIKDFSLCEVVVSCSPQYTTDSIQLAALQASSTFIDACCSYPQAIIEAAVNRLPFHPTMMEATQSSSGCSIPDIWRISHQLTMLPIPRHVDGRWFIDQDTVSLDAFSVTHRFEFASRFGAYLFWIFALFLRFIFPVFSSHKAYSSTSRWWFSGRCLEHHQEYRFKAQVDGVEADALRPDLALYKALAALGISRSESHDWGCCSMMKVKLTSYSAVQEKEK